MACDPAFVADQMERWQLRRDGSPRRGAVAEVLPVRRADGTAAVLKVQPVDDETAGEPAALGAWDGQGAVRLLEHDPATGAMLLERLDPDRSLSGVPDDLAALRILSQLLGRLVSVPPPPGLRRLQEITEEMLAEVPRRMAGLAKADDQRLVRSWSTMVADLLPVREHRLLHWDLHYDNVLAGEREPWLAIDPKPLVGDPGFELLPALWDRWDDVVATGDAARAVRRRFDLMVDMLALDRERAVGWTVGRLLQEVLWELADGAVVIRPMLATIAGAVLDRQATTPGARDDLRRTHV